MQRLYADLAYSPTVGSYWETTARPLSWPELAGDRTAETVIIGGGYTGLNCALQLVESGGDPQSIVILEAEQPGYGASGRNGGFCCLGGAKLPVKAQLSKFGEKETVRNFNEQLAAIETVRSNLSRYAIEVDRHSEGEVQLAHRHSDVADLENEQRQLASLFATSSELISKDRLAAAGLNSPEFHGALCNPNGFAVNPMKYVAGLVEAADKAGIKGFGNSPALRIERSGERYKISTPSGSVSATNLVIATNGYSSEDLPTWLAGRLLPVLTNIIVTRPLSKQELADQGWTSFQMCYDTRNSLHYFRLMPSINGEGPRMMFGMRGGTQSSVAMNEAMKRRIRGNFDRFFPAWTHVETPFFWSGLVCLTRNLTSYTGPVPEMKNTFASLAYHGNGVAMGSHCGRLLGKMISREIAAEDIPAILRQQPQKFPFPSLRTTYLKAIYHWYEWRDG